MSTNTIITQITRLLQRCLTLGDDYRDPMERHRAQLLASVLLVLLVLGTGAALIELAIVPGFLPEFLALLAAVVGMGALYLLVYRRHKQLAAIVVCMVPTLGSVGGFLAGDVMALAYLLLGIVLAGAFLSVLHTALLSAVNLAVAVTLLWLVPPVKLHFSLATLLAFFIIFSALRLVLMRYREKLVQMQQHQLQQSEQDLRAMAQNATEGILVHVQGSHVFANHYLETLLGYEHGGLIGTQVSDLVHPTELARVKDMFTQRARGEGVPAQYESILCHRNGEAIPVELSGSVTLWHGQPADMVMVRDIRERLRQKHELERQRTLLQTVISNSPTVTWMLDPQGIVTLSEGKGLQQMGLQPGQLVGVNIFTLYQDYPEVLRDAQRALAGDQFIVQREVNGRVFNTSYTPWLSEAGVLLGSVGVATDITEIVNSQMLIQKSKQELENILRNMQDTIYRIDAEGCFVHVSGAVERLLGYTKEELLGSKVETLYVDQNGRERLLQALQASNGEIDNYEVLLRHKDGSTVWVSINAHYLRADDGEVIGIEGTTRNVTRQKQAEERMRTLSSALEQTADLVMIADNTGVITYVNAAFEKTTGYSSSEAIGKAANLLRSGKQSSDFYKRLWETICAGNSFSDVFINRRKDGELYYEEKTITPLIIADGTITHFVATGKDISDRMQTQERLRFMAHHDALTELPNRTLFLDRLKQSIARARWHERKVAVMFMDLDRFKIINDTLGHNVGDQLLVHLTQRLAASVRTGDTVARFGGDEFAILLDDIASEQDIAHIAKKMLTAMAPVFQIEKRELFVTASIGVSIFPNDGEDSEVLLRNADVAMYRAKDMGRNNFQFYSSEMSARAFERLSLENSLRYALKRNEFFLLYQPQYDARTGLPVGAEALLRWQHPELGLIMPNDFVMLLEETGLIVPVGEWVLREACRQAKQWHESGINLRIAVNLSGRQFNDADFLDSVQRILAETGIVPEMLELELTESLLMRNASMTIHALDTLNSMGVRLAIDDFGTGYSSLSYLRRFPIRTLKIDRSFVRDVIKDPDDTAIATAIIVMAQSLYLEVVAEGVETEEQLMFLQSLDCHLIQGFYFSAAVTSEAILALYRTAARHPGAESVSS